MIRSLAKLGLLFVVAIAGLAPAGAQTFTGVFTQHNDIGRTGQNLGETALTPQNVNTTTFGKVFSYSVDGQIYAEPLYVPNVSIPGQGPHNIVYVATENDSVFAFDADNLVSTPLWQVSFINPAAGITPVTCTRSGTPNAYCSIYPYAGITSTPVIDPTSNTMYLVSRSEKGSTFYQTLHALDITTGAEKFGGPVNITGSVPGTGQNSKNGVITFPTNVAIQRAGLLEANGQIYIGWAGVQHGWVMAYNATTLKQTAIFNTTPNSIGGGVWASGNGIPADASGNVYVAVADGMFDINTGGIDYGDTVVQFNASLDVLDTFTPLDQNCRAHNDMDLGSGGPMLMPTQPGSVPNELLISGKGGPPCDLDPSASPIYLLNVDNLGGYNATQDQDVEEVTGAQGGYWSSPAYWQGASSAYVYYAGTTANAGRGDFLKMYSVTNGLLSTTPVATSSTNYPDGATPSISANGTTGGVLWAVERPDALGVLPGKQAAVLYAYDATNVTTPIYASSTALSQGVLRDRGGCANKMAVPTIANGRVYVGTQNELDVFGLLGTSAAPGVYFSSPCLTFPTAVLGTPASTVFALTNSGSASLTISNISVTGTNPADFVEANNCTAALAPGKKCSIKITFTPSILGPESAFLMVTDNAVGSPHNVFLVGSGEN